LGRTNGIQTAFLVLEAAAAGARVVSFWLYHVGSSVESEEFKLIILAWDVAILKVLWSNFQAEILGISREKLLDNPGRI
jgi:hypothetical protein